MCRRVPGDGRAVRAVDVEVVVGVGEFAKVYLVASWISWYADGSGEASGAKRTIGVGRSQLQRLFAVWEG